jgi:hypothetical protein
MVGSEAVCGDATHIVTGYFRPAFEPQHDFVYHSAGDTVGVPSRRTGAKAGCNDTLL